MSKDAKHTKPQSEALESLFQETRVFRPLPQTLLTANQSPADVDFAREQAEGDYLSYWEDAAQELDWFRKWDAVLKEKNKPDFVWFPGSLSNITYNALDRHIETGVKNRVALIWEGEAGDVRKLTYFELFRAVNRLANAYRRLGIVKGDRILLYMPHLPETVVAMLAAAKVGAVHCFVHPGYGAKLLARRIVNANAKLVVSADGFYRNARAIKLKSTLDEALDLAVKGIGRDKKDLVEQLAVEHVLVVKRAHSECPMQEGRDKWYHEVIRRESTSAHCEIMEADAPLFLLHTSGTTGEPKGILHSHAGYMVGVHRTFTTTFDVKATDIYFCTADMGWITGHSYLVYGPLLAGTTVVMYEGHPLYPQADRIWDIIQRHGVTLLYTTPTLCRLLIRNGPDFPDAYDLSDLRIIGSVGEPIGSSTWMWLYKNVGRSRVPVLDTWWQTETGMIMAAPLPVSMLKPGSVQSQLPGVSLDIVDDTGKALPPGKGGRLVVTKPWPAMLLGLDEGTETAAKQYWEKFPGMYDTGDMAVRDNGGSIRLLGRADDVLKIAGHRVSGAEVENVLSMHPAVAEAAVVPMADEIRGETAKALVVPTEGSKKPADEMRAELIAHVRTELGPVVVVGEIAFVDELPKTKSGKIQRNRLRTEQNA
jgi:acetyl-CoA synthetase